MSEKVELKIMKECESLIGMTLSDAIDKQIGKAVVCRHSFFWCPVCNGYLKFHDNFCSFCGQKIDWEGVE